MVQGDGVALGTHWMLRATGCDAALLSSQDLAERALRRLVEVLDLTAVSPVVSRVHDRAVVAFVLLAESHASVHTDPKHGALFADVFSCGSFVTERAGDVFRDIYDPDQVRQTTLLRGPGEDAVSSSVTKPQTDAAAERLAASACTHHRGTYLVTPASGSPQRLATLLGLGAPIARHRFEPQGQSAAWSNPQRRLAVHTWPELGLATVDLHASASLDLTGALAQCGWTATDRRPPSRSRTL